jgi:(1->4)-alpha-D-glucan 1-alpha-D-glucosylmutase
VAPRLLAGAAREGELPLGEAVWGNTWLDLGEASGWRYRDVFSGQVLRAESHQGRGGLPASAIFEHFPLGLLERLHE